MESDPKPRIPLVKGDRPILERLLAESPAVLAGFRAFRTSLDHVDLAPEIRARVVLLVAEAYGCAHVLSRAVKIAGDLGLPPHEIEEARHGHSEQHAARAVLRFAEALLYAQGRVTDADLEELRVAGYAPPAAVEIVAHVALGMAACLFAQVAALPAEDERVVPYYEQG